MSSSSQVTPGRAVTVEVMEADRARALRRLATAMLLAMTPWFSATAVLPQLRERWLLTAAASSLLTISVQVGFVAAALLLAATTVSDRLPARRLFFWGSLVAAVANGLILVAPGAAAAVACRFVTGAGLAAVYPPGMKELSTWYRKGRGFALGVMIGALTIGSALPHLVNWAGGLDWRIVVVTTSLLAAVGGSIARWGVADGPFPYPKARFELRHMRTLASNRAVRLTTVGYLGHMWELYAMWSWIALFYLEAVPGLPNDRTAALTAFLTVSIGAVGCAWGGKLADRIGREWLTARAMGISALCAAVIGIASRGPVWIVLGIGLVWGATVVADSAQFSTIVTEVSDQSLVGTALTLQLALGYCLTTVTIWLVPVAVARMTWTYAFLILVPGPVLGTLAMSRLRALRRKGAA